MLRFLPLILVFSCVSRPHVINSDAVCNSVCIERYGPEFEGLVKGRADSLGRCFCYLEVK